MSAEEDAAAKAAADKAEADAKAAEEARAKAEADEVAKLGEAGKRALDAERDARSAAEKKAKDAEKRLAALEAKAAEDEAAKAKSEEDAAAKRGEFEQLANKRAEELKAIAAERDASNARLEKVYETLRPGIDADWAKVQEFKEVAALYTGADDDLLAKLAFLSSSKPVVDALRLKADPNKSHLPMTPRVNGTGENDAEARAAQARSYRDW